jgi:hypothetical protein
MTTASISRPATDQHGHDRWITTTADIVRVGAWHDPTVEAMPGAIPTASDDTLIWYTPNLGALSVLMAHRWATYSASAPSNWQVDDIARTFGLGESVSRVRDVINRMERFGIIRRHERTIAVRLWLPPLSPRQIDRLPKYLAVEYTP